MKLLGLDVGTTGVKAAVFDESGRMCGYGFRQYPIQFGGGRQAEQDAELVWRRSKEAIAEALAASGNELSAISLSVQGDAVIPVGRDGKPLAPCMLGMDYRCQPQAEECARHFGAEKLFRMTGMRPHPINAAVKMMWFAKTRPELHEKTDKYMTYADYLLMKLGADEPVVDETMASRYMAMDLQTRKWSDELLAYMGVEADKLSAIRPSGTVVGTILPSLAEELGVRRCVPILTGGHDQPCAALGAGMVDDRGLALDSHGTAEVLSVAFDRPLLNRQMFQGYYPCTLYAQGDRYFTFALNHTGGILLQWMKENICEKDADNAEKVHMDPFAYLLSRAPMDRPSKVLALPHFNGSGTPDCDLKSRGAFVGLTMDTTREELTKAVLDALSYEMKLNLAALENAGISIRKLRCVGGAAKSEAWLQMKADVLNLEVETLVTREAACLGAAMIAGVGTGAFKGYQEAARRMVLVKDRYQPDPARNRLYESRFALYRQLYPALKEINHQMTDLQ